MPWRVWCSATNASAVGNVRRGERTSLPVVGSRVPSWTKSQLSDPSLLLSADDTYGSEASTSSMSCSAVPPASIQSEASLPSPGSCTMRSSAAWLCSARAMVSAWFRPASSASGTMATRLPYRTESSESLCHLPAPIGQVVATKPRAARLSASFSPSTTETQSFGEAEINSGSR